MFKNYANKNVLLINLQFSQKQSGYFCDDPCRMIKYFYVGHSKVTGFIKINLLLVISDP